MSMFNLKPNEGHLKTCGNCKHFKRVTETSNMLEGEIINGLEKCVHGLIAFRCELYGGIGNACESTDCEKWSQK